MGILNVGILDFLLADILFEISYLLYCMIHNPMDHLIVFGHRMPGHLSPLGDGAVIRLVGVNFHILPDLPLLLGEFLR